MMMMMRLFSLLVTAAVATASTKPQGISLLRGNNRSSFRAATTNDNHQPTKEYQCFQSNPELRQAVKQYQNHETYNEELATKYGWPIGNWCVGQVTDFSFVFQHQRYFNEPLTHWDTSRATTMQGMFQDAQHFQQDLSHFNTSHVENFSYTFEAAIRFEGQGLERWNTGAATTMDCMFLHALQFHNGDIRQWQVQNVRSMKGMLKDARAFTQEQHLALLAEWDFYHHVDLQQMSDYWIQATSMEGDFTSSGLALPPIATAPTRRTAMLRR